LSRVPDRSDLPNTRKVANNLDIQLTQQLGVTDTRTLQDLRSTEGSTAENDELASSDDSLKQLALVRTVATWNVSDADSLVALKDNTIDASIGALS
jgi:hypothetical protein